MRILFVCNSLEPGRDGVGDYTRRLNAELIRQGHTVSAMALNDPFANNTFIDRQEIDGNELPVLRIPSVASSKEWLAASMDWINDFDPEWLSLQFVPFGFNNKGLPFKLGSQLVGLGKGRRWHIMFHELWVGMDKESSVKRIWWGAVQKLLIRSLIRKLKPRVIHTQTSLYNAQLRKLGFESNYLPLFANIPLVNGLADAEHKKQDLQKAKDICFVNFGTIHPGAPVRQLAKEAAAYRKENGTGMVLKFVGRCGPEQERWTAIWNNEGLTVEILGEQSKERVSEVLSSASIGLSTTPIDLAEKSGSVAAMRDHRLPVLCVARGWHPRGLERPASPPGITEYSPGSLRSMLAGNVKVSPGNNVSAVSHQFINALLAAE